MNKDVFCPFRLEVPEGHSTFTVIVPRDFAQNRQFNFADLCLAPDYYNTKSAQEGMDTDQELDATTNHEIYVMAQISKNLFPQKFELKTIMPVPNFVKEINHFFENTKPEGINSSVFFFDWIDTAQAESGESIDNFIQSAAVTYYGKTYDPAKHYNALPISVRALTKQYPVNNYLYPTQNNAQMLGRLRWRMWIGPNTCVYISTDNQLKAMGFSELQIGPRHGSTKQFIFENLSKEYKMLAGVNAPNAEFTSVRCNIYLEPSEETYVSCVETFTTTIREKMQNSKIESKIKNVLAVLNTNSNFVTSMSYDLETKKINFNFPNNENFKLCLCVTVELAGLLGYGLTTTITKESKPNPRPDTIDVNKAGELSRTLAFDTGIVIVEVTNNSCNTTFGLDNKFMASLYPNESGILTLSQRQNNSSTLTMKIPAFMTGSSSVPVEFRMLRFIKDNTLVPLVWKTGAFVNGVLRGSQTIKGS